MRHTINPTRRNRNIGTAVQGHGQDNSLTIPQPLDTLKSFYEQLISYEVLNITVHNEKIPVIIEELKAGFYYSCTPQDVELILNNLPQEDLEEFGLLVFRQPKKKEKILSSVWGRLIYAYQFRDEYYPAIIIEAIVDVPTHSFPKRQSVDDKSEFKLLQQDGLEYRLTKREYVAEINPEIVRNIQLYRTLLHEVGHYTHYLKVVDRPGDEDESFEEWEKRYNYYFSIPQVEKESFANTYAVKMKKHLEEKGIIPFNRIEG